MSPFETDACLKKKRKDYAYQRQPNDKPSIMLGCPVIFVIINLLGSRPSRWLRHCQFECCSLLQMVNVDDIYHQGIRSHHTS